MRRPSKLPKYVKAYVDRHGKARYYFRRKGCKEIALPGAPWSSEFMAVLQGAADTVKPPIGVAKLIPKSMGELTTKYLAGPTFVALAPVTKRGIRRLIAWLQEEHGHRLITEMRRRHVDKLLQPWRDRPSDHNRLLSLLRQLLAMAVRLDWVESSPVQEFEKLKLEGFYRRWSEAEISSFEAHWAVGTKQRLAFDLLLQTGQRSGDVRLMGRHNIENGRLVVRQSKTGKEMKPPITPALRASLDTIPDDQMLFISGPKGVPFIGTTFSNFIRDAAASAGLPPDCTAHGLRKSMTCRLAEAGCTAPEIMSITGHSLKEAERYIAEVNRDRLSQSAMKRVERLGREETRTKVSTQRKS